MFPNITVFPKLCDLLPSSLREEMEAMRQGLRKLAHVLNRPRPILCSLWTWSSHLPTTFGFSAGSQPFERKHAGMCLVFQNSLLPPAASLQPRVSPLRGHVTHLPCSASKRLPSRFPSSPASPSPSLWAPLPPLELSMAPMALLAIFPFLSKASTAVYSHATLNEPDPV